MYEKIKRWHEMGLWNDKMVQNAARKGLLTPEQAADIIGGESA